jgi:hypothetical protein
MRIVSVSAGFSSRQRNHIHPHRARCANTAEIGTKNSSCSVQEQRWRFSTIGDLMVGRT